MTSSPHTAQRPPLIGCIAARQSGQTGSLEMFVRGAEQIRQSEGNSVANRLPAMLSAQATSGFVRSETSVPARLGYPLLLKTSLLRPDGATGAHSGRTQAKYNGAGQKRAMRGQVQAAT